MTYAFRLGEEIAADAADAVRAYAVTTAVFDLPRLWATQRALHVPTAVSDAMVLDSRRLLDRASRWFLTNRPQPLAVGAETARFAARGRRAAGRAAGAAARPGARRGRAGRGRAARAGGAGATCALESAALSYGFGLLDVVELTELSELDGEPREPQEVAAALLRPVRAPRHRPGADLGERAGARRPLARAGPARAARRPVRLAARRSPSTCCGWPGRAPRWTRPSPSGSSPTPRGWCGPGRRCTRSSKAGQLDLATLSVVSRQLRGLAR